MTFIGIAESILAGLLLAVLGFFVQLYLERSKSAHKLIAQKAIAVSKENSALNIEDLVVSAQGSIRIKIRTHELDAGMLGVAYRKCYNSIENVGIFLPLLPIVLVVLPFVLAFGFGLRMEMAGWDLAVYLTLILPLLGFCFYLWKSFMKFMMRFPLSERVIHVYGDSIMTQRTEYLNVEDVTVYVSRDRSFLRKFFSGFAVQLMVNFGRDREVAIIYSNWLSSHVFTDDLLEKIAVELQTLIEDAQSQLAS